jgi:Ca-activated chloride channel family protein
LVIGLSFIADQFYYYQTVKVVLMLADFHFIRPFWLLALVPALVFIVLSLRHKLAQGNWDKVCDAELLPYILQDKAGRQQSWTLAIMSIASVLTILALAGPTWERLPSPVFRNDAAVVIALDLSLSMNATDIKPSRLERARYKVADLLKLRKDGLTALIVYAGDAFIVTPLTEDIHTINSQLNALNTDIMPSQGSNAVAALQLASELLKQAGQTQGGILLISDGINNNITKQASALLGDYQLSVLGIGTADGAPITLNNGSFLKDHKGNIVVPKLDAAALKDLASTHGGIYQKIQADDSDITAIINKMDNPTSQNAVEEQQHLIENWAEKGPWLLLLILPLAALYFRKGLLIVPVIILLPMPQDSYAFSWQDLWQTQDQQAQQAFEQQQFEQAEQQFQSPEWKAAAQYKAGNYQQAIETLSSLNTADSFYNQGNALAKTQQLPEALAAYQQALDIDPQHEDAKFNRDLVEQALKEQQQEQQNSDQNEQQQHSEQQAQSNSSTEQKESEQPNQQSEQQDNAEQESQSTAEQQQDSEKQDQQADEQQKEETEEKDAEMQQQADVQQKPMTENEQANAQWLQRIPDDPAGLLKRKFKYQYGQRKNKTQQEQSW